MTFNSEEVTSELTTILDYIRFATSQFNQADLFFGHGTESAHDEAVALVLHTLHQPYDLSKEYLSAVLTVRERQTVVDKMQQRITTRKPLAYLTNSAVFAGLDFYVDERVLVPRSPIAELIEQQFMPRVYAGLNQTVNLVRLRPYWADTHQPYRPRPSHGFPQKW